jgi:hypothetical protein
MPTEITQININTFASQTYETQDTNLIPSFELVTSLGSSSYIEFFIYDLNKNILSLDYNFSQYQILNNSQSPGNNNNISQIQIDPESVLLNYNYNQGNYITYFNFLNKKIGSYLQQLYISEISSDRTEIRLNSTSLTIIDLIEQTINFIQEREDSSYFLDFYLNFGDNQLIIANNLQLDDQDPINPTVLVKLYEPLPVDFILNSKLWVVASIEESIAYQVNFENTPIAIIDTFSINGPNFNLGIKDQINNSTLELSLTNLLSTSLTSSQNQINSLLEEKEISINIDYSNFFNYVHFSSAKIRLENFYYKLKLIEEYSSSISLLNNVTNSTFQVNSNVVAYETNINNIITNFDNYEYYLYYNSGSYAWPKSNLEPPYQLVLTSDPIALTWLGSDNINSPYYGGLILSASLFDNGNKDNLLYTIPEYLRDDPSNQQYELFIEMVGQFYDNIWVYYRDVTEKYNADNRLDYGISKDIVADAIRDFGIKLYQNNFSNEDLYTAFLGLTPEGSLFPFPNITGSLPTPSGYEYVDTLISASNDYMPLDDVNKSLYKRIYHNLPYLLKSKGTLPGLRALITSYGIPDTVLRIKEYGGKDKVNSNDWDYWQDVFNYAFTTPSNNFISTDWDVNPLWGTLNGRPDSISFRFKTTGLPQNNIPYSQSLWNLDNVTSHLLLKYTGSGYTSGSYSGSNIDPYYQYASLEYYPNYSISPSISASIYLPFFNGGWWSVLINRVPSTSSGFSDFTLYAGNKIYEGGDNGTLLGFYSSSTVTVDDTDWTNTFVSYFGLGGNIINGNLYDYFSGSFQEIRYFKSPLSESVFKDYIMNPYSIEGNNINSSPDELIFRASLGGELYTGSTSIHPKVTGSWISTSSFALNSDFNFLQTPTFIPNTEYFFYDQPIAGIRNSISDKIRLEDNILPAGDTLSPFKVISQQTNASQSYTANTNLLEVSFSPQDEINDDITSQIGYFNIGDYIGDPRERFTPSQFYPDLNKLRDEYFQKYIKNYNLIDFIRLIKFFDNSLFKMIKDFVPVRTSLASGIVIKQHILERNKYPQPKVDNHSTIAYYKSNPYNTPIIFQDISVTGTLAPQWNGYNPGTVENFSGGTGGTFEIFNGVNSSPYGPNGTGPENIYFLTQSWVESTLSPLGPVNTIHDSQDEFYDGEFSGSNILVTTQSLAQAYPLQNESFLYKQVHYYGTTSAEASILENNFVNPFTQPQNGEILFYNQPIALYTIFDTKFIKISKIDCNGNNQTIALENITKIYVYNYLFNVYIPYTITNVNELSSCFLYETTIFEGYTPFLFPNQILDYSTTSSINTPRILPSINSQIINSWEIESGDAPNYFNTSSGIYTLGNTPQIQLTISASIDTFGALPTGSIGKASLILLRNNSETSLITQNFNLNGFDTTLLSTSIYPIQQDQIYIRITKAYFTAGTLLLNNAEFSISQSVPIITSSCYPVILEPYVSLPYYYNSDYNPLINNVDQYRLNSYYQAINYYPGIVTPINFDLLINNSALKASIPDSNYTTERHTIPRYKGSKSTSQLLNVWSSPGTLSGSNYLNNAIYEDVGTYGLTPTVESLKTIIAFAEGIGGWPPERMNASAITVKYLIKSDGSVVIPNTTENSLADIQDTFITDERIIIQSNDIQYGEAIQFRNVIRGGSRIEPILYTQFKHSPATWGNIELEDLLYGNAGGTALYRDVKGTYNLNPISLVTSPVSFIKSSPPIYESPLLTPNIQFYIVPLAAIEDAISLTFFLNFKFKAKISPTGYFDLPNQSTFVVNYTLKLNKKDSITSITTVVNSFNGSFQGTSTPFNTNNLGAFIFQQSSNISFNVPAQNLQVNDEYYFTYSYFISSPNVNNFSSTLEFKGGIFKITQYPNVVGPIIPGNNDIWGYYDPINYLNVITSSNTQGTGSTLSQYYDENNEIRQKSVVGSGFNPIVLPWNIKRGDEFRFEGREDLVYMVDKVYGPGEGLNERLSTSTPEVIEVHFNANLVTSSLSSNFNLDHFLIRRYIDDASQIIMGGFRPSNSTGPYLIRPEYVVPELNKNIDEIILDLTQKGLI